MIADEIFGPRLLRGATDADATSQLSETCMHVHEAHRSIKSSGLLFNNAV